MVTIVEAYEANTKVMKQNNETLQEILHQLKSLSAHLGILDANEINEASEVATQQDPLGMEIHQMFDELPTPTNAEIMDETIQDRFGGSLDVAAIVNCVDFGHEVVTAVEVNASDLIQKVVTEYRVDFDADSTTMVIDHTDYAVSEIEGEHTLIASDEFIKYDVILGSKKIITPVLFQGIGHSLKYGSAMSLVSVVQEEANTDIFIRTKQDPLLLVM
ncbi:hypothetical protein V6N11_001990 [Hibiscus sabdariffa]|uniref:Dolichyl-diphosphooligosaccharide--protein glycosyltransferase 48 kDa subunit n=1 Tax=Hibiscus sabdariffa TaxID=183260 RepID=A0ABR2QTX2_9ROSI